MNRWIRAAGIGAGAGVLAALVKGQSEPRLQSLFEARFPPTASEKTKVGADPTGHAENMPPAVGITRIAEAVTGSAPPDALVSTGSQVVHLGFGAAAGALYALATEATPWATLGGGVPAGYLLYAATHASTVPLSGLQPPPTQMPRAAVLWESTSHAIFGLTVEIIRRLASAAVPA